MPWEFRLSKVSQEIFDIFVCDVWKKNHGSDTADKKTSNDLEWKT